VRTDVRHEGKSKTSSTRSSLVSVASDIAVNNAGTWQSRSGCRCNPEAYQAIFDTTCLVCF